MSYIRLDSLGTISESFFLFIPRLINRDRSMEKVHIFPGERLYFTLSHPRINSSQDHVTAGIVTVKIT